MCGRVCACVHVCMHVRVRVLCEYVDVQDCAAVCMCLYLCAANTLGVNVANHTLADEDVCVSLRLWRVCECVFACKYACACACACVL